MDDHGERAGSLKERVARVTEDVARKMQTEVGSSQVVSATRERAQGAAHVALGVLPATREDIARLQESLDRIETALVHLTARVDGMAAKPPKPKPAPRRRPTASAGDAKPKG
jgi:hypothetical protein